MTVTLILTLSTDNTDLFALADEVDEALQDHFDVVEVKPWARPVTGTFLSTQPSPLTGPQS